MFVDTTAGDAHVNQGQLRPLGVTRPARWDKKPDVPAIAEFYPGFELTGFLGMALPAATPRPICERLNALVNKAILSPDVKDRLESFGFTPKAMSLEECDAFSKSEREKWKRYVEIAGIEKQ
jgi:tripartite-type tricarboxylate transporter receptor subunit TctC